MVIINMKKTRGETCGEFHVNSASYAWWVNNWSHQMAHGPSQQYWGKGAMGLCLFMQKAAFLRGNLKSDIL